MSGFSLLDLQNHSMSLLPCLRSSQLGLTSPQPLVTPDLFLQVRRHLAKIRQVQLPLTLTQANCLQLRDARLKKRFELVPCHLPFRQSYVLCVNSYLPFLRALREHEMLRLDPLVHLFRVLLYLAGSVGRLIEVRERLEAGPPAPRSQRKQHLPIVHALAGVRETTVVLEMVVELGHVLTIPFRPQAWAIASLFLPT